ncbi:MAG: TIGR03617 family F420-dependent LLM class oxidoreductase [Actinomycetia bacterium]|nr:TIGR03617 family F420-dependent LLM class oxidoreductase [Actinomycetes bacterium]
MIVLVDVGLSRDSNLRGARDAAPAFEQAGYNAMWTAESDHDPFLPLAVAADYTTRIELGTSIAVAFARSPMTLANLAWDLQEFSNGRFLLGLGTQIEAHITRRFSMPWSQPAKRMRELVLAVRAIWDTWLNGTKLDFRGDFFSHTLMTPFFTPSNETIAKVGLPKVFLAGVGPRMTEVAGEVCDGFICHGFNTESYLREVTLPALARGRALAGKTLEGFEIVGPSFVVTGANDEEMADAMAKTRQQLGFYASTPAYRGVLEHHGWADLGVELHQRTVAGEWAKLGESINDEVLNTFAVVGDIDSVADQLHARYGDIVSRIRFAMPNDVARDRWAGLTEALRAR